MLDKDVRKSYNVLYKQEGVIMSDKEKSVALRLADVFPKIDEKKQNYILGYVECLAALREEQADVQLQSAT